MSDLLRPWDGGRVKRVVSQRNYTSSSVLQHLECGHTVLVSRNGNRRRPAVPGGVQWRICRECPQVFSGAKP